MLDKSLIDHWIKVSDQESFAMSRKLIKNGLLAGTYKKEFLKNLYNEVA
jgi:cysteine synthase